MADDPHPYLDQPGPIALAHQGGGLEPAGEHRTENTMAAFQNAVDLGYRYLETDVQTTSDGVMIAFHDDTLDRFTDRTGKISDMPWSEVQQATIVGGHQIVRIEELWERFGHQRFNFEAKSDQSLEAMTTWIRGHQQFDRICVASFNIVRLKKFRRRFGSDLCTSTTITGTIGLRLRSWYVPLPGIGGDAAQVPVKQWFLPVVDQRFVAAAHDRGIHVHVWTIDDADEMNRLLDLGVDGILTDRPSVAKQVLESRDQWFPAPS
jgi:glycerophosphoryl diester phosphodiesterase